MKSLFQLIDELNITDDFSVHFYYLNLSTGWDIIDKVECSYEIKNKIVKYVAYAWSPDSPLFRVKKDRFENKINAAKHVALPINDLILDVVANKNKIVNDYIWWWVREHKDRNFAMRIALEEAMYQQLKLATDGINADIECSSLKETTEALAYFKKMEISLRGDAMKKAMSFKDSIDSLEKKMEVKYQYLQSVIKKEIPEVVNDEGWAEFEVFSRQKNDS